MLTLICGIGNANRPIAYSGTIFHVLRTGQRLGVIHRGLNLSVTGHYWNTLRIGWNLAQLARGGRNGGFQFSNFFLEHLWRGHHSEIAGARVLNCYQQFPDSIIEDTAVNKWFFIDQTQKQLFECYGVESSVDSKVRAEALSRERRGYQSAEGVITNSRWAAVSVVSDYGIPSDKVYVVPQGANLDHNSYGTWLRDHQTQRSLSPRDPLRLVFVGKDWKRKGLDTLILACRMAVRRGVQLTLRIIGCTPNELPGELVEETYLEWLGRIDKRHHATEFLALLSECDVGCLLSRAEAGGIAAREYHALGLPVIATDVGGLPDQLIHGASLLLPAQPAPEYVADVLVDLATNRDRLAALRWRSWQTRKEALWDVAVRNLSTILGGSAAGRAASRSVS